MNLHLILPYFRKNLARILLGILCMIVVDVAQLAVPTIIKDAVDILARSDFSRPVLVRQFVIIVGLGLVMMILRYFWRVLLMGSARDLEKGLRNELYAHILTLDQAYFNRVRTGDIMAHATSDINHIRMAFGIGIVALTDALLLGTACIGIMLWMNPGLALISLIPMPFLSLLVRYLGKKMHLFHTQAQETYSDLTELIREGFSGIRILKLFNLEPVIGRKVADGAARYVKRNLKRAVVASFLSPVMGFFFNLSTWIVLFYGGFLVMRQSISPGELVAFIQYLGLLAWPILAIGWMTNLVQRGLASLKRVNTMITAQASVISPPGALPCPPIDRLEFDRVKFGYDGQDPVLQDICLKITTGSTIGLAGPPGSGKTSLAQLIPRLYDPVSGQIFINGIPIDRIDLDQLREQIAFMPQEPFLFSGTLRENILMGRPLPEDTVDRVLAACQLTGTMARMPRGLDTRIGEKGVTLSGGQKQRIALARTLIQDRPVTILDDPISQVDTQTAFAIIAGLRQDRPGRILIIISHRISALAFCDRIHILSRGRITHSGTHEQLMDGCDFYRSSYAVQQFEKVYESET